MSTCQMSLKEHLHTRLINLRTNTTLFVRVDLFGKACCQTCKIVSSALVDSQQSLVPSQKEFEAHSELDLAWSQASKIYFDQVMDLIETYRFKDEGEFYELCSKAEEYINQHSLTESLDLTFYQTLSQRA